MHSFVAALIALNALTRCTRALNTPWHTLHLQLPIVSINCMNENYDLFDIILDMMGRASKCHPLGVCCLQTT